MLKRGRTFSFEFFPPKTVEGEKALFATIEDLRPHQPSFVSVTYGAGGSTRDKTIDWVSKIKHDIGIEAMAHLTCVGAAREEIFAALRMLDARGIENILALRGDPPKAMDGQVSNATGTAPQGIRPGHPVPFTPHPQGYRYACELVGDIRRTFRFDIGVAGYPEGHPECQDLPTNAAHLQLKIAAGAGFVITQLFFDNRFYFDLVDRANRLGVHVPIIPGIMPVTNYAQIQKFTKMCGVVMPPSMIDTLERIHGDDAAVLRYGVDYAVRQCQELLDRGAPGIHFYTLNRSPATREIFSRLRR